LTEVWLWITTRTEWRTLDVTAAVQVILASRAGRTHRGRRKWYTADATRWSRYTRCDWAWARPTWRARRGLRREGRLGLLNEPLQERGFDGVDLARPGVARPGVVPGGHPWSAHHRRVADPLGDLEGV